VLVEGAGGLLVRFDDAGGTLADVAWSLAAPVLLVADPALGTLNSTALTAEALARRGIRCLGVVVGRWPAEPDLAMRCNLADLPVAAGAPLLGVLPDGSVLTESAAILIALGLAHPASGLLPEAPAARAQAIRGLVYVAANCYAAIGIIDYPERWCTLDDAAVLDAMRAGTRARLHRLWELFADQFPAAPRLSGARVGALDLLAAVVSRWSGARPHLARSRPALHEVLERIDSAPAVAGVFARHWPA